MREEKEGACIERFALTTDHGMNIAICVLPTGEEHIVTRRVHLPSCVLSIARYLGREETLASVGCL